MRLSGELLIAFLAVTLQLAAPPQESRAQASSTNLSVGYRLLATRTTSTMRKELNEAAAEGYRPLALSRTSTELVLLLAKGPPSSRIVEYRLLDGVGPSELEEGLNTAARRGFRLLPRGARVYPEVEPQSDPEPEVNESGEAEERDRPEVIVVLERDSSSRTSYEYRLLRAILGGSFPNQRDLDLAASQGFQVVDLVSRAWEVGDSVEHIVILERSVPGSTEAQGLPARSDLGPRYRLLTVECEDRITTPCDSPLQEELNRAAAAGYRLVAASRFGLPKMFVVLERVATSPSGYRYLVLATQRMATLQKELGEAGREGFHPHPRGMLMSGYELMVVTEKAPEVSRFSQSLVLSTHRASTMQKELTEATGRGYRLVDLMYWADQTELVAILQTPDE